MSEPTGDALNDAWFSPNGKLVVTASDDGTVRIWSAATGSLLRVLSEPGHSAVYNAAFSPNGGRGHLFGNRRPHLEYGHRPGTH